MLNPLLPRPSSGDSPRAAARGRPATVLAVAASLVLLTSIVLVLRSGALAGVGLSGNTELHELREEVRLLKHMLLAQLDGSTRPISTTTTTSASAAAMGNMAARLNSIQAPADTGAQQLVLVPAVDPTSAGRPVVKSNQVAINLHKLLDTVNYYGGISFDAFQCGVSMTRAFPNHTPEMLKQLQNKYEQQLLQAFSEVMGKAVTDPQTSFLQLIRGADQTAADAMETATTHPLNEVWRRRLTQVMARFMVYLTHDASGKQLVSTTLHCATSPAVGNATWEDLGRDFCPDLTLDQIVEQVGYHAYPLTTISSVAGDHLRTGSCTKAPQMRGAFGQWLVEQRMFNDAWKTFNVENLDQDAVVFLYDVLYEHLGVFKKQTWLGSIMMQHPYDMLSISDIIWTVRPDLIIETGTANGGSALLWASMMHLNNIDNGRVITIDLNPPAWEVNQTSWGGKPKADATKNPLWAKHVTFIKGGTTEQTVWEQVRLAAKQATSVLVLLDSHHAEGHVSAEAKLYCPFVTVGSYCILEDTKLSRYAHGGPLEASTSYVRQYAEDFEVDRTRELVFTQHAMGYLRRKAIKAAPVQFAF